MTLSVTHTFVSAIPDDPDALASGEILPQAHWNAMHTITGTVGNASLDDMAANTIKGRLSTTGAPQDLTGTQTTTLLDTFTSSLKGLAPSSGGGAVNFLRADGTWAAPAGSGIVSDGDKGDITVSSTGTVWTIDSGVVTLAKMATMATASFLGRNTAGTGAPEVLSVATSKTMLGLTGTNSGDQTITLTGDVTGTGTGSFAATIAADAVTYAKMQNVSATSRFIGRITSGSGDPEELTGTQATTLLDAFTTSLKGLAPSSGGGTTNFLRADGTWNAPPSGGTPAGASLTVQYNNASAFGGMSGTSWDDTNRSLTMTGATVTTSNPVLNITQTWNAGAVAFNALTLAVTNTASATGSIALKVIQGSNSIGIGVDKTFGIGAAACAIIGCANTGSINTGSNDFRISAISGQINFVSGDLLNGAAYVALAQIKSGQLLLGASLDAIVTRTAAATLQFGAADASTAVAQTTQVQSVVAGTSNTAGADWTFQGSRGTGTGVGGNILFNLSPDGTTGTVQNAAVQTFKITAPALAATVARPSIQVGSGSGINQGWVIGNFGATGTSGIWTTNAAASGTNWIFAADSGTTFINTPSGAGTVDFRFGNSNFARFGGGTTNTSLFMGSVFDLVLSRGGAATLQQGAADAAVAIAQTTQVQSVVAGTANGTAGADWIWKASSGTGTGTGGNFILKTPFSAKSSGTGQGTWVDRGIFVSKGKVLTSATPVSLFEIALPSLAQAGGTIYSTIVCTNGTDMQSFSQSVSYSVVNKAGVYTKSITASTGDKSVTGSSTLTTTWSLLDGTNKSTVQVSATTSLTPSTNAFLCYYSMWNNSEQATTIL